MLFARAHIVGLHLKSQRAPTRQVLHGFCVQCTTILNGQCRRVFIVGRHRSAEEKVFGVKGVLLMPGGRGRIEVMERMLWKVKAAFSTTTGAAYRRGLFDSRIKLPVRVVGVAEVGRRNIQMPDCSPKASRSWGRHRASSLGARASRCSVSRAVWLGSRSIGPCSQRRRIEGPSRGWRLK